MLIKERLPVISGSEAHQNIHLKIISINFYILYNMACSISVSMQLKVYFSVQCAYHILFDVLLFEMKVKSFPYLVSITPTNITFYLDIVGLWVCSSSLGTKKESMNRGANKLYLLI